jgi:hypothetical protein
MVIGLWIFSFEFGFCRYVNHNGYWNLDFADTLTTMIIGFGVKFKYCLGLTNLKTI